ncbi:gliding motility-associated C-terminal domain-containing protein [Lutibacter oricola]|uniref:Gliding motility-associated C-terminal domain-containing protein n=1 Tax=Lutibacter oricola TaxID=762486 RepID=A0A1H3ACP2_9FLAO|nr:T9SS type B sorting domain-containing protein [Lutibacter oricola]SDX27482.1 gliding motility-associated C-terminal domain-containing protein [Lutibacter oricola]
MKKLVLILFILFSSLSYSQGEANFWYFGLNAGIDFNGGTPSPINGSLSTNEGCSSFSDKDGNLLFYSDGTTVWDRTNNVMPNGSGLLGSSSSTQSAIIVPHPGNTDVFYIFTVGANFTGSNPGLNAYTVDMTLNGGLGDVFGAAINLSDGRDNDWTEKVTSVKGADCNSYWIISLVDNSFYSYKVDTTGLINTPVISNVNYNTVDNRGYLKVSPDGTKIACATFNANNSDQAREGRLHLYSFNDATGVVSNDAIGLITDARADGEPYGVEFSPNSTKLYTSVFTGTNNTIYQFDLTNTDIPASKTVINSKVGYRGALQLAPNGKIYATVPVDYYNGTNFLDAINVPDALGTACNFENDALDLNGSFAMQGLPPFIASILIPVEITDGVTTVNINNTTVKKCVGDSFNLEPQNIPGTPIYTWTYNSTVISSASTLNIPSLGVSDSGVYNFHCETTDLCGFKTIYEGEITLEVYTNPTLLKPANIEQCDDDNDGLYNFDLPSLKDTEFLNGQDPAIFEITYFTSQTDADANTNAITTTYQNSSAYSTDTIYARIHNKGNINCYLTESFTIQIFETPTPSTTIVNYAICDSNIVGTDTDGIEEFDLTTKETEILNGQNPAYFNITYFTNAALTNTITTPTAFQNTISGLQTIYVLVENASNNTCSATTSFNVEVFTLPIINSNFTFKQCDEDGVTDGFTDFNLDEANDYLTNGDTALTVTYFDSFNNADTNNSPIVSAPHNNSTLSTVFARIENTNGCHRVAQVDLLVSATSFPAGYLKTITACDDDAVIDGLHEFDLSGYEAEIIALFPSGQNLSVAYYRNLLDAQLEQNEIPTDVEYTNEVAFDQTLFVRVESDDNGECFGMGQHLQLIVQPRPEFEIPSTEIFCQNLPYVEVDVTNANGIYTYQWFDSSGTLISTDSNAFISSEGEYTAVATSLEGCESFPQTITIVPSIIATITLDDITVVDDTKNNSVTIEALNLGIGDYEFTLDDIDGIYQDDPVFENVVPGIRTIFIRDKNNCGAAQIDVSVIGYPKFFTPNNDGYNDTWQVLGVNENFYATSNILIFDRFGKLITKIDPKGNGWNGVYNGQTLPAADYWFSVELTDKDNNTRIKKGHFSLVR